MVQYQMDSNHSTWIFKGKSNVVGCLHEMVFHETSNSILKHYSWPLKSILNRSNVFSSSRNRYLKCISFTSLLTKWKNSAILILIYCIFQAKRDESTAVDQSLVKIDVQALFNAGENRLGTDESEFNEVLCQRSHFHLLVAFDEYQKLTSHDFEEIIKSEFSGDGNNAFLAIVRMLKNKPQFFAKKLNKSVNGLGTNDSKLIRIVVTL